MQKTGKWLGLVVPIAVLGLIFVYTKTSNKDKHASGKKLYATHCASCHGAEGEGLKQLIPPVNGVDYVVANSERLSCIIRYGVSGEMLVNGKEYTGHMLGLQKLEPDEIRDIVNMILVEWNGQEEGYSLKEIRAQIDGCALAQ